MTLYDEIVTAYSDLTVDDFDPRDGSIGLSDDGDGVIYIAKWDYSKPIPSGMKLGK